MSSSEELQGQCRVCHDCAPLLPDGLADGSGGLDVSGLPLGHSEQGGDALDAVHELRRAVLLRLSASEGSIDSLVDDLRELRHGQIDESSVGICCHCLVVLCLASGGGLEPPCPRIVVCSLSLELRCSCSSRSCEGPAPLCVL